MKSFQDVVEVMNGASARADEMAEAIETRLGKDASNALRQYARMFLHDMQVHVLIRDLGCPDVLSQAVARIGEDVRTDVGAMLFRLATRNGDEAIELTKIAVAICVKMREAYAESSKIIQSLQDDGKS